MNRWAKNVGAVLLGLSLGWLLLEVGLSTLGNVHADFAPGKATLSLQEGAQAVCYQPGSTDALPLDLRRADDRAWLAERVQDWRVGHREKWALDAVFDRYPHCVTYNPARGTVGTAPGSDHVVLLLGDSFAFGEGLRKEDTVQSALGQLLPDNVLSYATRGADLPAVQRQLQAAVDAGVLTGTGRKRILYLYNLNDLVTPERDPSQAPETTENYLHALDDAGQLYERWGPRSLLERLLANSLVWWWFQQRAANEWVAQKTLAVYHALYLEPSAEAIRAETRQRLRVLARHAAARGATFQVVLYPMLVKDADGHYPLADLHREVLDWCEADGIACYDAADAILSAGAVTDLIVHDRDRHPNKTANRAMASFIKGTVLSDSR